MTKTLIKGGQIISMDARVGVLKKGDVLIDGEKIVDVAPQISAEDAKAIDASRMIVMPGLVDSHLTNFRY